MQPPPLPTPTSQLTEKEGWVGVEVGIQSRRGRLGTRLDLVAEQAGRRAGG